MEVDAAVRASRIAPAQTLFARYERWQERWRESILTALLVLLSSALFIDIPLSHARSSTASALAVTWLGSILATGLIATRRRAAMIAMVLTCALVLAVNALRIDTPSTLTICAGAGSLALFMVLLGRIVWGAVYGPGTVTYHRVCGAIVLYLSIALAFAAFYQILLAVAPGAISGVASNGEYPVLSRSLIYYSLSTITSTGYGDLLPVHPVARSLSNLEAVIGQLFPATFVARIVAREMQARRSPP